MIEHRRRCTFDVRRRTHVVEGVRTPSAAVDSVGLRCRQPLARYQNLGLGLAIFRLEAVSKTSLTLLLILNST